MHDDSNDSKLAYESPDTERPASASPTEAELERELVGAVRAAGHDPYAALRIRDFRFFTGGLFAAVIAGQIQTVAALYEIYQKTGSALSLGGVGLALAIPMLVLALPAGHFADTHSRRAIVMVTQLVSAACAIGLAWLSFYHSGWVHSVAAMYVLLAVGNAGATFGQPARAALLPQLVPAPSFGNAVTWNSSIFETGSMVGPAIGGFVCARSIAAAYVAAAVCWIVCFFMIGRLPDRMPARDQRSPGAGTAAAFADLVAGIRFVWRSKLMLAAMTLDLFAVLLGGATFLLPLYASNILGVGATGFGWLRAAPSIGAFSMALLQAHTPPLRRAGRTLILCVAGFGVATIIFGLSRNYWLSLFMLVLTGAFDNISVVVRHTLLQMLTPDSMRGRVSAVNQVFIGSSNELGGLESGVTAQIFGPVISVVGGGIGTLLVVAAAAVLWPELRRLGCLQDIRPIEA